MSILGDYVTAIQNRIEDESAHVAAGRLGDFAEYKFKCGLIVGLNTAISMLEDIVKSKPREERH
jgi:hypothetical protein